MTKLKNNTISLISLDIETTGLQSNSAVVSIGAYHIASIKHNRERSTTPEPEFYAVCNVSEQARKGAYMDSGTISWWATQSEEIRQALDKATQDDIDNSSVTMSFLSYIKDLPGSPVWVVQAADFDIPIINSFLIQSGSVLPGFYRHKICLRTLLMTNPVANVKNDMFHNALSDAKAQAKRFAQISSQSKELLVDYLFTSAGY
jgi:DNA polymerase III epsilon subunit-like protein